MSSHSLFSWRGARNKGGKEGGGQQPGALLLSLWWAAPDVSIWEPPLAPLSLSARGWGQAFLWLGAKDEGQWGRGSR